MRISASIASASSRDRRQAHGVVARDQQADAVGPEQAHPRLARCRQRCGEESVFAGQPCADHHRDPYTLGT